MGWRDAYGIGLPGLETENSSGFHLKNPLIKREIAPGDYLLPLNGTAEPTIIADLIPPASPCIRR